MEQPEKSRKKTPLKVKQPLQPSQISLNPPWANSMVRNYCADLGDGANDEYIKYYTAFITERSRVHETYIVETNRTKRLGLIISVLMLVASGLTLVYAPPGREILSYFIGAGFVITAGGVAGYTVLKVRAAGIRLEGDARRT